MSEQCKEKIFHTWSSRNCSRKAVTDGYCKQHHPDSVKAARLKSEEKWARERENTPLAVARRTIESQERRIKELENGLIKADDVYGVWYNESEDILVAKERDIAELVKVLILIDTHNLLHNNADQLQIEIKEQIAKHIMEIGL